MATTFHPRSAGYPVARRGELAGGRYRTAILTSVFVLVGSLAISVLMAISILASGSVTWSDAGPVPAPMPQPSATAGLDI